jgi:hypothetical protein
MPFHLAAYSGFIQTEGVQQPLPPVTDMYLPSTSTGLLLPTALEVVAAYATSPTFSIRFQGTVHGLQNARINAPSLLRVAYPYIRPLSQNLGELTDPNVMNLIHRPLALPASEVVGIDVVSGLIGDPRPSFPNVAVALLWLCDHLVPAPPGESFALRFATTTVTSSVAGAWSPIGTVVFDQNLPPGSYSVIGFEHWSQTAIAARLIFPGMATRPGSLSLSGGPPFPADARPERLFFEGGIGVFGTFSSFAPPSIEVLTALDGDTDHEGYLTVVRTGDIQSQPPTQRVFRAGPLRDSLFKA